MVLVTTVKIRDVARVKGGKRLPKGNMVREETTRYPYIRVTDLTADGLDRTNIRYIDKQTQEHIKRYTISADDVYISIAGTIGLVGIVPDDLSGANLTENAAKICEIDPKLDKRFLMYYLRSPTGQGVIASKVGGVAQPKLALYRIEEIEICLPPLNMQRECVAILSAYDDLIENNARRMKVLEEMAQVLYREWFIQFRLAGHEVSLVDSPVGVVPQGWEVKRVKDVLKRLTSGQVYTEKTVGASGRVPVIDQSRNDVLGYHNNEPDHVATPDSPIIAFGDHTCKMRLMVEPFSVGPNVVPFVSQNRIPILYLYYIVRDLVETREYKRHWTELTAKHVVLAPNYWADRFAKIVTPIFEQIDILRRVNLSLRRTRDLLLPKLISGETLM
jgi:type I restriction enzyme S subunit